MTIAANVPGLPPMHFPDGTDPAVIQKTVQQIIAGNHPSQQQNNAPETPISTPATQPVPMEPANNQQPQAAPAGGGDGYLNDAAKMAQNAAQGGTFGLSDSIGAGIAKPITYALKNVLPKGAGGEDVSYDEVSHAIDSLKSKSMSDLQAWNNQNPGKALASQVAGGIATMGPLGDLASAAAPETTSAIQAFSKANPYKAAAATGGITGGLYGAGEAQPGDTVQGGVAGAVGGALFGPLFKYAGDKIIDPILEKIGSSAKSAKSGLQDYLKSSEKQVPIQSSPISAQYSNITNMPLGQSSTDIPANGELPMPPAVRNNDREQLRVMEKASKGGMGPDAEAAVNATQQNVLHAAKNAAQAMKGENNNDTAPVAFEKAIQQFQDAGDVAHKQASELYKGPGGLNQSAAVTTLNKPKVAATLGAAMKNTVTDPNEIVNFEDGTIGQNLYNKLKGIINSKSSVTTTNAGNDMYGIPQKTTTVNNELPVNKLMAWRREVSDASRAIIPNSDTHAAGVLGDAFDKWMGAIPQDHVLSGDPDFAAKAQAASQGWRDFKTSFPQRASPFMPGEAKPFDMTPADHAAKLIGNNGMPTATAARQIRGMVTALPDEAAKTQYRTNVFSGAVDLASRGLNGDVSSLTNYRNNLQNFRNSQLFREQFIPEAQNNPDMKNKIAIMDKLIPELNTYISNTTSRRVVSPSGGAIADLATQLAGGLAKIGVPLAGEVQKGMIQATEHDSQQAELKTLNRALKEAAKIAAQKARSGPVFNVDSLKAGLAGGLAAGNVVQQNSEGVKK